MYYFPENTDPIAGQPYTYPYVMFFDTSTEGFYGLGVEQLGLAYSQDGLFWTRYGTQPILLPSGNTADWDGKYTYQASAGQFDGTWHMYFSGANDEPIGSDGNETAHGIGYASSIDGINWVKTATPIFYILDGVAWRNNRTYTPEVLFEPFCTSGSSPSPFAKMWFTGANSSDVRAIGYATLPCPKPLPPASFTGVVKQNIFLNKCEYVLYAQWPASISPDIAFYRIYNNDMLVCQIPSNARLQFRACNRCKNAFTGYNITAVDTHGTESIPTPLTVIFC